MGFALGAILMIALHLAPNLAGFGWSIYQEHGLYPGTKFHNHHHHVKHHAAH